MGQRLHLSQLLSHGVPCWLVTQGFGHNDMFWYRLLERFGRNSLVGTTVCDPSRMPVHLAADEHHTVQGDEAMRLPRVRFTLRQMMLWVGLVASVLASAYCFLGVEMMGSFGGQPGHPLERAAVLAQRWGAGMILFLCVALVFAIFLVLGRRADREPRSDCRRPAMRLPRFRLRTMMIAVVVLALALGAADLWRRRGHYRRLAEAHALAESVLRVDSNMVRWNLGDGPGARLLDLSDSMKARHKQADHHARLRRKYDRAAARPWLPVEPDPPEPN